MITIILFKRIYNDMLVAVDQKDSGKLKADLEKLYADIVKNQNEVEVLLGDLKAFRDRMAKDTNSFKEDTNQLTAILASTNAGIPALEQQINTYNDSIKKSNDMVIAGGVLRSANNMSCWRTDDCDCEKRKCRKRNRQFKR